MDKNIYIERLILLFIHFSSTYLVALNEKQDVVIQLQYLLKKVNFKLRHFFSAAPVLNTFYVKYCTIYIEY